LSIVRAQARCGNAEPVRQRAARRTVMPGNVATDVVAWRQRTDAEIHAVPELRHLVERPENLLCVGVGRGKPVVAGVTDP
jgi:hypothetical protein